MLILVRYAVYSAGRVTGRYSHLGCWLAVEMVIDGRLRQGKALISRLNLAAHIQRSAAVGRQASRQQPSTPALSSFFATRTSRVDEMHTCTLHVSTANNNS